MLQRLLKEPVNEGWRCGVGAQAREQQVAVSGMQRILVTAGNAKRAWALDHAGQPSWALEAGAIAPRRCCDTEDWSFGLVTTHAASKFRNPLTDKERRRSPCCERGVFSADNAGHHQFDLDGRCSALARVAWDQNGLADKYDKDRRDLAIRRWLTAIDRQRAATTTRPAILGATDQRGWRAAAGLAYHDIGTITRTIRGWRIG
jgi:hypothetical protein